MLLAAVLNSSCKFNKVSSVSERERKNQEKYGKEVKTSCKI